LKVHTLEPWELILADTHFSGPQAITKWKRHGGVALTPEQQLYNKIHEHYRARNESLNGYFKHHQAYTDRFRGTVQTLSDLAHFTAHCVAVHTKFNIRAEPVGPWPHDPAQLC